MIGGVGGRATEARMRSPEAARVSAVLSYSSWADRVRCQVEASEHAAQT